MQWLYILTGRIVYHLHTPPRIDLGKHKYGGPFTYEQVEDVKTFYMLLQLTVYLFGFQLSGDGYSLIVILHNE